MRVSTLANNLHVRQQVTELQAKLSRTQSQIASGKKAEGFRDLRADSLRVLTLRNELQTMEVYKKSIAIATMRLTVMQDSFSRMGELGDKAKINAVQARYENEPRLGTIKPTAETQLAELINLANSRVDGRSIFSGAKLDEAPVVDIDTLLNGNSLKGLKGLNDLIADRRQADGVDNMGQPGGLATATTAGPGATATLTDNSPGDGFGFTLETVAQSGGLSATPTGSPTDVFTVSGFDSIAEGDTVTLELGLPDGSTTTLTLTATREASETGNGAFLIGADEDASAGNFANELRAELETLAATELRAASANAAAAMMFDNDPPLYVGDPGGTPTVETDDPDSPTVVQWYRGDTSAAGRDAVQAKVDDGTYIGYGVRANEAPIRDTIKSLAVFASIDYQGDTGDEKRMYFSLIERVTQTLSIAGSGIKDLQGEIGIKEELIVSIETRHESVMALSNNQLSDLEGVDLYEAAARFSEYETSLQASYSITARVQSLSLVNFL